MEWEGPFRVQKSQPLDPMVSQLDPLPTLTTFKTLFNIILPYTLLPQAVFSIHVVGLSVSPRYRCVPNQHIS
jgi:hypothetical protein